VTDAGTPGVSDPGLELIQACIAHGIAVEPIPGATAPLTALVGSGFPVLPFTMFGFPPNRSKARIEWLRQLAGIAHTFSFFETPHHIQTTLVEAADVFGNRPIVLGRELTKLHQEFARGTAAELSNRYSAPKGEFTVVVGPAIKELDNKGLQSSDQDVADAFRRLANSSNEPRRALINRVAESSGRSPKDVYAVVERIKKLVERPH